MGKSGNPHASHSYVHHAALSKCCYSPKVPRCIARPSVFRPRDPGCRKLPCSAQIPCLVIITQLVLWLENLQVIDQADHKACYSWAGSCFYLGMTTPYPFWHQTEMFLVCFPLGNDIIQKNLYYISAHRQSNSFVLSGLCFCGLQWTLYILIAKPTACCSLC